MYRGPFSFLFRVLVAHFTDPCVDFFHAFEGGVSAEELLKGVFFATFRAEDGFVVFDDEFDAIAFLEAEAGADLLGYGDLSLAADGAGAAHDG